MKRFSDTKEFADGMQRVTRALDGFKYCLIGGRAVEMRANPPQTPDLDFLVMFGPKDAKRVIKSVEDEGFALIRKFFDEKYAPMLFFKDVASDSADLKVDIIGAFEDVHEWAIERATMVKTKAKIPYAIAFPCAQAEDIVIMKANAALSPKRGEKAERDKAAIVALAESNDLDADYIEIVLTQALADWSDERELLLNLGVLK